MTLYVRRPIVVEAKQYLPETAGEIINWYNAKPKQGNDFATMTKGGIAIPTVSGTLIAAVKDWVVLDGTKFQVWKFGDFENEHRVVISMVDGIVELADVPVEGKQ
jgi:hypothetical protein